MMRLIIGIRDGLGLLCEVHVMLQPATLLSHPSRSGRCQTREVNLNLLGEVRIYLRGQVDRGDRLQDARQCALSAPAT